MTDKKIQSKTASPTEAAPGGKVSAKQRRALQRQRQQRQQQIILAILAVVFLLAVIAVIVLTTLPPDTTITTDLTHYQDFEAANLQGTTSDGFPYLGPANAPVNMEEFASFACPFCLKFHQDMGNNLLDEFKAGRAKLVFIPLINIDYDTTPAASAALCAGQQGKFWEFHDILFDWQSVYAQGINNAARLGIAAQKLGLDMNKFNACLSSSAVKDVITKAENLANQRGVTSTPTVFINGKEITPPANPSLAEWRGLIETTALAATTTPSSSSSTPTTPATAAATQSAQ